MTHNQTGECYISVESAGPNIPPILWLIPGDVRLAATRVIQQCIGEEHSGGFESLGYDNLLEWIFPPSGDVLLRGAPYPSSTAFVTVTVSGPSGKNTKPGDFDPGITGEILGRFAALKSYSRPESVTMLLSQAGSLVWLARTKRMQLGGRIPWWAPETDSSSEMSYECDVGLGSPSMTDCAQLQWSQLGPPSDTVAIGPGQVTFLHLNACYLAISASVALVLTWAQVRAALLTLFGVCVYNPAGPAQGGRAYFTTRPKGRSRDLTSSNALPPHANVTIFEQSELWTNPTNELHSCTWRAVKNGLSVKTCNRA